MMHQRAAGQGEGLADMTVGCDGMHARLNGNPAADSLPCLLPNLLLCPTSSHGKAKPTINYGTWLQIS
jgi:hypothetical protein